MTELYLVEKASYESPRKAEFDCPDCGGDGFVDVASIYDRGDVERIPCRICFPDDRKETRF